MPPISTGDLITAVQFNELVTSYNKLWGDNVVSALFADITTNFAEHSHGWGQVTAEPTVIAGVDEVKSSDVNQLLAQMNAGLYHYDETSALIPHFSTTVINASYITSTIEDKITDMSIEENRFKSNDLVEVITDELTDTSIDVWDDYIISVAKIKFSSYDEARYFFNAGGKLSVNLEQSMDVTDERSWESIFNTTGEIRISALDIINTPVVGDNTYTKPGGFYGINPNGEFTDLFTIIGYVASGDYAYNAYSNRSIKISLKAEEVTVGGEFNVYVKVTLTDDITSGVISAAMIVDYGYVTQNTTPVLTGGSFDAPFTAVENNGTTHVYQFIGKTLPLFSSDTTWGQSVEFVEPGYVVPGYTTEE
jgi:hypothetical protein